MIKIEPNEETNREIAERWCDAQGLGWKILDTAGRGGTAPVFTVQSPDGIKALKLLDKSFSEGVRGDETEKRVKKNKLRLLETTIVHTS